MSEAGGWVEQVAKATQWRALEESGLALGAIRFDLPLMSIGHRVRMDGEWPCSAMIVAPMERIAQAFGREGLGGLDLGAEALFLDEEQMARIVERQEQGSVVNYGGSAEICSSLALCGMFRNAANFKQASLGELVLLDAIKKSAMLVGAISAKPEIAENFMARWESVAHKLKAALGPSSFFLLGGGFAGNFEGWRESPDLWPQWPRSLAEWKGIHDAWVDGRELSKHIPAAAPRSAAPRI